MKRISCLEKRYVLEVLSDEFRVSRNNVFNERLEKEFAKVFRSKYAIGHVNGTATLHAALAALDIGPDDEVIVPPLTMSSPALAVLQNGSIPVFADVDRKTFTICPDSIKKCITSNTRAVISVSLYGLAPDYNKILDICRAHKIHLIEDNAQCFLGKYKGRLVGEFGSFSSFSFQATKHMTCGEGGMLITRFEDLANKARKFSNLGYMGLNAKNGKISRNDIQHPAYNRHGILGFNYRLSEINAAVALGQLQRLKKLVEQRRRVADIFDKIVCEFPLVLIKQKEVKGCENSYWSYAVVLNTDVPEHDWHRFKKIFQKNGGDAYYAAWRLTYTEPLFLNNVQKRDGVWQQYRQGLCPNAEYLQPRMIQLKTNYWNLSDARKQARILKETLKEFVKY